MTLDEIRKQLVINNEEQQMTTDSVNALTKVMIDQFKLESRGKLDEMEALREAGRKGSKAPRPAGAAGGGGFDFAALLSRFALPALTALAAELAGFDDFIKSLKVPDYLATIRKALNSVSDGFKNLADKFDTLRLRFMFLEDELKKIKIPSLEDITAKLPKITIPESITTFYDNLKTRIASVIPSLDDLTAKLPKLQIPESVTKFTDSIKDIDFPKMPKLDLSFIKTAMYGADGTGGIYGFLKNTLDFATDLLGKIPGLKFAFRLVGGPVTQAIVSLIDFFTGFYKAFVGDTEPTFDEFGNVIEDGRTITDKILDGLEGGFDGVVKGIVEGFQLLFIELPKWLLKKMGVENTWLDNIDLWGIVSPLWEFLKAIPKFIFSAEYRQEQIDKVKAKWEEAGGIVGIAMSVYDAIVEMVNNALASLPSPSELAEKLVASLPQWMRPDTIAEQRADLEADLAEAIKNRDAALPRDEMSSFLGITAGKSREGFQLDVDRLQQQLAELPEMARGGYTNPMSNPLGSLVKIHPNELVLPLGSTPEGQALTKLSKVLNTTAAEMQNAQREYSNAQSMPTVINNIVNDNSVVSSQNVENRSSFSTPVSAVDTSLPVRLY